MPTVTSESREQFIHDEMARKGGTADRKLEDMSNKELNAHDERANETNKSLVKQMNGLGWGKKSHEEIVGMNHPVAQAWKKHMEWSGQLTKEMSRRSPQGAVGKLPE